MTIIGSLHSLRCDPEQCVCDPIVVTEPEYNDGGVNEAPDIRIADGPASVLIPPGRGRSHSRGMRP